MNKKCLKYFIFCFTNHCFFSRDILPDNPALGGGKRDGAGGHCQQLLSTNPLQLLPRLLGNCGPRGM